MSPPITLLLSPPKGRSPLARSAPGSARGVRSPQSATSARSTPLDLDEDKMKIESLADKMYLYALQFVRAERGEIENPDSDSDEDSDSDSDSDDDDLDPRDSDLQDRFQPIEMHLRNCAPDDAYHHLCNALRFYKYALERPSVGGFAIRANEALDRALQLLVPTEIETETETE
jgi:hypothetical protein